LANTITLPDRLTSGLYFCTDTVLKIGIILLDFRLSLLTTGRLTLVALPFVIATIAAGLMIIAAFKRKFRLSRQLSGLNEVDTGICGCTAIDTTAPPNQRESGGDQLLNCLYHRVRIDMVDFRFIKNYTGL